MKGVTLLHCILLHFSIAKNRLTKIEVTFDNDTVWLSIDQMSGLFQRDRSVIGKHIRNIFKEGELEKNSVWAKFAYTASDDKDYQVDLYNLGVVISVEKCYLIIKRLHEIAPSLLVPKFSEILELESTTQNSFYKFIFQTIEVRVPSPLTAIFNYAVAPEFSTSFNIPENSVKSRVETLNIILRKTSFHQTHLSTDIRFIIIYFTLLSGKLSMPTEILDLILEYPKLQHSDEKMKMIRQTIRSMEISPMDLEREEDSALLNIFWKRISKMSDCELMYPDFSEEEPDTTSYMKNTKRILEHYSELSISTDPLNSKMLVLLGISIYSYKRLLELVEHNLFNSISGRGIIRVLIEDYIMMKYLLKKRI
jgi:hypothetical protein